VDAARAEDEVPVVLSRRIEPSNVPLIRGHTAEPQALLALAQLAYGRCPPAWWVTIPAQSFDFGADLSPMARRGGAAALRHIRALIRSE
jgi:Ni,Fe-hydrogenase maturation factor